MAAILVDYENVGNVNGLRGVDVLNKGDTLIIFSVETVERSGQIICSRLRRVNANFEQ